MNGTKRVLGIAIAVACLGTLAMAATDTKKPAKAPKGRDGKAMFAAADSDGNGTLSLAEFSAAHEKRMAARKAKQGDKWNAEKAAKRPTAEKIFKKLDQDGNAALTPEEMKAGHKGRGKKGADKLNAKGKAKCDKAECDKAEPAAE